GFARTLRVPVTVALHGDLGMGKTEIARAIINELCSDTVVPSPTFTLVQTYTAKRDQVPDNFASQNFRDDTNISHFDLYRITDASELEEIGLPHAVVNDITLIEWPEIAAHILPDDTVHVYITGSGDERDIRY
ncbi:MAG: tRNA (adenosine(37)-N6)-threonylcarbamoyltransferase complex ATPase subunit type 1 TsaE, partial [Alphaproteobacteria bacterium]|nr:tRNA (adenosine(37)-N6)-threonylcarbamoyltransferase complex ATPase subunit type 1 TsaE [Alphaproteobacteria bacterium]